MKLAAILGTGRSGTTWLGAMLSAHPDVAYRYEPFHRMWDDEPIRRARELLESHTLSDDSIPLLYEALIEANPLTDKPPFFRKRKASRVGSPRLRRLSWLACRPFEALHPLYRAWHTPRDRPTLIFKEIVFEYFMGGLLERTSVPVVYLVRHPCATVLSTLRGQQAGDLNAGRLRLLPSLIQEHDPSLIDRLSLQLDRLSDVEKNALLWRIDVEAAVAAIERSGRGMLVTYGQLCEEPYEQLHAICAYFGLEVAPQITAFLDELFRIDSGRRPAWRLRPDLSKRYFTVYRNPLTQLYEWKSRMPLEQQRRVEALVADSHAFQTCAALGHW